MPICRIRKSVEGEILHQNGNWTITKNKGIGTRYSLWEKNFRGFHLRHTHRELGNKDNKFSIMGMFLNKTKTEKQSIDELHDKYNEVGDWSLSDEEHDKIAWRPN